jgi:hypothetical protein
MLRRNEAEPIRRRPAGPQSGRAETKNAHFADFARTRRGEPVEDPA